MRSLAWQEFIGGRCQLNSQVSTHTWMLTEHLLLLALKFFGRKQLLLKKSSEFVHIV